MVARSKHVLPINRIREEDLPQAGRKCVQLGDLLSAGFQVPRGFCILTSAYEIFVRENALEEKIQIHQKNIAMRSKPIHQDTETELVGLFQSAVYPTDLKEEILKAYRMLSNNARNLPRVAVRSSGSQEDGFTASFAGQFESYLNIRGPRELLDQIKCCWASFWNTRSLYYQMDRGGTNGSPGIAILVQEMIPARSAGVLFSANPVSGSKGQMVIEASWGLGETIVNGTVAPDRFVVDMKSKNVVEATIQNKECMVILDKKKGGTTHVAPVPSSKRGIPCLSPEEIETLVNIGKRVQEHFGSPQDIEWAFDGQNLYLLQARPITTLSGTDNGPSEEHAEREIRWQPEFDTDTESGTEWTSATIRDMLPGALSPLTISQMSALEYGFRKPQEELGLVPRLDSGQNEHFLGFFYNRAHLNMSLIRSLVRQVPLVSSENLEKLLEEGSRPGKAKSWLSFRFAKDLPNLFRVGLHALEIARRLEPAAEDLLARGLRQYEAECQKGTSVLPPKALLGWMEELQARRAEIYAMHITTSEFGEVAFQLLKQFTRRLAKDEYGELASQLITGSSTPLFAKPIAELWGLAQMIEGSRSLQRCFNQMTVTAGWRKIQSEKNKSTTIFREAFNTFLDHYGYRSRYGAELMHPSWDQEPIFILSMIKLYSKLLLTLNPWEMEREQAQRRRDTLRRLESHLNPISKRILYELLKLMQILIPLRQNLRALSLMQAHLARKATHQLSDHLQQKGFISEASDIFFLTTEEVHRAVAETLSDGQGAPLSRDEMRGRIERRKVEYKRNLHVVLPERFRGKPQPLLWEPPSAGRKEEKRLRGIPASPGRVTGQARRISVPAQEIQARPGEILILPGMDPGWTPLFLAASAIVTERGGVLSHGSVLAREYGIPAVVSIPNATRIIKAGQVITVDGDRGEVWL